MIEQFYTIVVCKTTEKETEVPVYVNMKHVEAVRLGSDEPGEEPEKVCLYMVSGESYILEGESIERVVHKWRLATGSL
jgi:hypothetical protein